MPYPTGATDVRRPTSPETSPGPAGTGYGPPGSPPPETGAEQAAPGEAGGAAPVLCQFCDAPATAACPRCGTLYCGAHGGAACDACSEPASGLPSPLVLRAAVGVLLVGVILALWLLIAPPRLPGEQAPAAGPDTVPAPARAPTAPDSSPEAAPQPTAAGTSAVAGTPPPATPTATKHVVKSGDTLGGIAAQYSTTIDALRAANPGINEATLQIGQEIVITPGR